MVQKIINLIALLLATASLLQAQNDILDKIQPKEPSYVRRGNQAYEDERYADAMTYYLKALDHDKSSNRALFNLGDTYYQKSNFDTAANAFNRAAMEANNLADRADAFYNAGNAHFRGQKFDKAIESYLSALQTDPTHPQARKNLAYAIKEMQQQQQQQQGGESEDQKQSDEDSQQTKAGEKDEQDESSDQDPKKQEDKEETEQEKDNPQESQDQEGEEGKEQSPQDQKEGENEAGQNLNRDQMEALLDRLRQKEQQTMKDVQKRKKGNPSSREKDW